MHRDTLLLLPTIALALALALVVAVTCDAFSSSPFELHYRGSRRRPRPVEITPPGSSSSQPPAACPCADAALCAPLTTPPPANEFLMFQTNKSNWPTYDWRFVTTVALFDGLDPAMLCAAHARGVRVVMSTDGVAPAQLANKTARHDFVHRTVAAVAGRGLDGVNVDFEYPLAERSVQAADLVLLMQELRAALKKAVPTAVLSMDLAWSAAPHINGTCGIDGRCFDYAALLETVDVAVAMVYDVASQMANPPPCRAEPNAPAWSVFDGIASYRKLGVAASKLILGAPWYFHVYKCNNRPHPASYASACEIPSVPFRGVPCSDAASYEDRFSNVMKIVRSNATIGKMEVRASMSGDSSYAAVDFQQKDPKTGVDEFYRAYGDVPATLAGKYGAAKQLGVRGIAIWSVDMIYVTDAASARDAREMWAAFERFL